MIRENPCGNDPAILNPNPSITLTLIMHERRASTIKVSRDGNHASAHMLHSGLVDEYDTGRMTTGTDHDGKPVKLRVIRVRMPFEMAREKGWV